MFRLILVFLFSGFLAACSQKDWRTASRKSAGLAKDPEIQTEAVVQIYAARAYRWRGVFAVHSWMATKEKNAQSYRVYEVVGWRLRRGEPAVSIQTDLPDRFWYGAKPEIIYEIQGEKAEILIPKIHESALSYPYPKTYRAWPGPNSNTFVSHILRENPEIGVELPPTAIGRDWLKHGMPIGFSETSTGIQLSILGALGFSLGAADGIEVNILGLNTGIDFLRPALKLPFIGRIGMRDEPAFFLE